MDFHLVALLLAYLFQLAMSMGGMDVTQGMADMTQTVNDMDGMNNMDGMDNMDDTNNMDGMNNMDDTNNMNGMDNMDGMNDMDGESDMGGMKNMDGNMEMGGMSMAAYFYASNKAQLMFEEWSTNSDKNIALATFLVVLVGIGYEALKALREHLAVAQIKRKLERQSFFTKVPNQSRREYIRYCILMHLLQTFLYMVQVFISMCLMLVFMTFNAWLCMAVVLGAGLGFVSFGIFRLNPDMDSDTCH